MVARYTQTFTVPGKSQTVFPALIEASRLAGGKITVDQEDSTVRVAKGINFTTFGNSATSRIVDSKNGQTTIETVAVIPSVLFDLFGVNKKYANAIKDHLFQLLDAA